MISFDLRCESVTYIYIYIYLYNIYNINRGYLGVYNKYMIRVRSQRKFTIDKPQRLTAEGSISGKLPMTKDEGHIIAVYTEVAMVHIIYYEEVILGYRKYNKER